MNDILNLATPTALPLDTLIINLILSLILSTFAAWFFTRFGRTLSNRARFAQNLPALAVTTVLIISVVQSSLALSLGLVGALSIVRFRTAIKETEELIQLFLAVAIGLGIGANQRVPTILAVAIILGYLYIRSLFGSRIQKNNLYFNLVTSDESATFAQVNQIVNKFSNSAELRRIDSTASALHATYVFNMTTPDTIVPLMDALRTQYPDCEMSFVEQDNMLTA